MIIIIIIKNKITDVDYVGTETKRSITWWVNAVNYCKKSIRLDTTGWARWSTGNCARNLDLTIQTKDICTNRSVRVTSMGQRDLLGSHLWVK